MTSGSPSQGPGLSGFSPDGRVEGKCLAAR